jgi:hypothetical protein
VFLVPGPLLLPGGNQHIGVEIQRGGAGRGQGGGGQGGGLGKRGEGVEGWLDDGLGQLTRTSEKGRVAAMLRGVSVAGGVAGAPRVDARGIGDAGGKGGEEEGGAGAGAGLISKLKTGKVEGEESPSRRRGEGAERKLNVNFSESSVNFRRAAYESVPGEGGRARGWGRGADGGKGYRNDVHAGKGGGDGGGTQQQESHMQISQYEHVRKHGSFVPGRKSIDGFKSGDIFKSNDVFKGGARLGTAAHVARIFHDQFAAAETQQSAFPLSLSSRASTRPLPVFTASFCCANGRQFRVHTYPDALSQMHAHAGNR